MDSIRCECGVIIRTTDDLLPHKAHFIADEDLFDVFDSLAVQIDELIQRLFKTRAASPDAVQEIRQDARWQMNDAIHLYSRHLFQCRRCGRLYVEDRMGGFHIFAPEGEAQNQQVLGSIKGKMSLRGFWQVQPGEGPRGTLWWGYDDTPSHIMEGREEFDDLEQLKNRYRDLFKRMRANDSLRRAVLKQSNNQILHHWSADEKQQ